MKRKEEAMKKVYCEFFSYLYDLCYGSDFARRGGWPGRYRKGGDTQAVVVMEQKIILRSLL